MSTVLVTGGSGFIGRHAVPRLQADGFEVHLVTHRHPSDLDASFSGVQVHQCELLDLSEQGALMSRIRPTHLLHFAWCTAHGLFWTSRENLRWVQASLELLRNFAECGGRRVVFAGSCAEGDGSCDDDLEETTARTRSLYGTCKSALQQMFAQYCRQERVSGGWGRIFFLYGPYETKGRLVPAVITALLEGRPARCTRGTQIRDFLHVEDVASAFCAFLRGEVEGVVNIGSGRPVSIKEIVGMIADKIGRRDLVELDAIPTSEAEPPVLVADTRRLAREIGWQPKYDLSGGLDQAVEWWRREIGGPVDT